MAGSAIKMAGFVIGGVLALYILYSLMPSVFDLYGQINFTNAPAGTEPLLGATILVFVALVLYRMWVAMSGDDE